MAPWPGLASGRFGGADGGADVAPGWAEHIVMGAGTPPQALFPVHDRSTDAQQSRCRRPAAGHQGRRRHVRRCRFLGDRGAAQGQGYDVVGVTLQLYDHGAATHRKGACCAGQDIHDARMVAGAIGIPHYVLNYESRFKEAVIDRFAESYVAGETPVPCVDCNQAIKFRDLLTTARELGAKRAGDRPLRRLPAPCRAAAARFSAPATRTATRAISCSPPPAEQIDFLRFPLGDLTKAETRELARRFALPVADKPDSQDICFVPTGRYADLIERLMPGAAEARRHRRSRRPGARPPPRHHQFHRRPAPRSRHRRRRAALRGAPRCREAPRRGRPAAGAAHHAGASARRQLDRRRARSATR